MTLEEFFRSKLNYDPETGDLVWNENAYKRVKGKKAGTPNEEGYIVVGTKVEGRLIKRSAHHIAWLLHHGEWPPKGMMIDHINGNKSDNRICNLRLATRAQNLANARKKSSSSSPYKGVEYSRLPGLKKKWLARISVDSRRISLGLYATPEEAREAYKAAAIKYFGEFARWA